MKETTLELYNNIFQYLIPILQFVLLIIPFLSSRAMYDNRRRSFFYRVSKRGYVLIFFALALIFSTIKQSQVISDLAIIQARYEEKNLAKRDSTNNKKNEVSNIKIQRMLAQYGFTVNTKNDEIVEILRDPNLKKQTIVNGESPLFEIVNVTSQKEEKSKLAFNVRSLDASSYDINSKLDIFALSNNNFILLKKDFDLLDGNKTIAKDLPMTYTHNIINVKGYNVLYFRFSGQYRKYDGTKIPLLNYYIYNREDMDKQTFGKPPIIGIQILEQYYTKYGIK